MFFVEPKWAWFNNGVCKCKYMLQKKLLQKNKPQERRENVKLKLIHADDYDMAAIQRENT
ncbi:hypothetical protein HW555_012558 [Spodoptera exigua]|uniref:Uncharacterized protein n=1 Tax=Spodoptera exigua TaxID=7107 RepID=A0A835G6V5_SPOEX|nr:hypothetical protein HW555_012558 [Spodoptera exigua]